MAKVQFNLLPDTKLEHNRSLAMQQKLTKGAYLTMVGSISLVIVLFLVADVVQKKQLSDSAKEIDAASKQLSAIPQIDNIITVQNQLKTLVGLHQSKHISSRIFTYLPQLTPADVHINKLDVDLKANTMAISGTAGSQQSVNTFVDTLKVAKYKLGGNDSQASAFPSVVQSGFTIGSGSIGYTINLEIDPQLFANNLLDANGKPQTPQLIVKKTPTGASLSPSTTLFNSSQSGAGSQ